jgi:hypothetical protein
MMFFYMYQSARCKNISCVGVGLDCEIDLYSRIMACSFDL